MLYFIVVWTFILFISLVIGLGSLRGLDRRLWLRLGDRTILALWIGLTLVANGLLAIALFLPLSPAVGIGAMLAGAGLSLAWSATRHDLRSVGFALAKTGLWWVGVLVVLIAAFTSRQVVWYDTGLYHFGSIRWLTDYGAVPGLGLINSAFAFVSAWFALAAPFNPTSLGSSASAVLSGISLLLALLHGTVVLRRVWQRVAQVGDWFWLAYLLLTLPLLTFTSFLSAVLVSPSPDIPVIFLIGTTAWAILTAASPKSLQNRSEANHSTSGLMPLLVLGTGATTFKLHGLPVLVIVCLVYGFARRVSLQRLLSGLFLVAGLTVPMLAHGVVASGCPLYPTTMLCADVPWRISESEAIAARSWISGWSTWFGLTPGDAASRWQIFQQWLALAHLNKIMLGLAILAIPLIFWLWQHLRKQPYGGGSWVVALSLLGMAFIFAKAPLMRFGLGYFVTLPSLAIASAIAAWQKPQDTAAPFFSISGWPQGSKLFVLFFVGLIVVGTMQSSPHSRWLVPPELPEARVTIEQINDITYALPTYADQCWGADLPCAPGPLKSDIQLMAPDEGIAGGFVRP